MEETAHAATGFKLLDIATHYQRTENMEFHHMGILYSVGDIEPLLDCEAEEVIEWRRLDTISADILTPIAKQALTHQIKR